MTISSPDTVLFNGKITTLDKAQPEVSAIAIAGGKVVALGADAQIRTLATADTVVIDLNGKRVLPGLNDSHLHLIRGGLNYNMELRWEGVGSIADALAMLQYKRNKN